jgi:nucleoside-diphosphate-sugar epimerase
VTSEPTVLLLGPAGLLGTALTESLAGSNGRLIAMTHRRAGCGTARQLQGDVTLPSFGLDDGAFADLAREVDVVVNCAAKTGFAVRPEQAYTTNVGGAARVLDFVARADARYVHLSTAFVAAELRPVGIRGSSIVDPTAYVRSKLASEMLVEASGLDCHVLRPSVVVGDSRTGYAATVQGFHFVLKSMLGNQVPMIPLAADARLDFLPCDFVAEVIARIVDRPPPERTLWITGGQEAWTIAEFVQAGAEHRRRRGDHSEMPRLVEPDAVERLIRPVFLPELPVRVQRRFEALLSLSPLVVMPRPLPSSLPSLREYYGEPLQPPWEEAFRSSSDFVLDGPREAALSS